MEYDVSLQTISWFNERKNDGALEISPKFQRRAVWLERERSALLDTILSRLPFPEVYVHVETDGETGKQNYSVVDGQQRITSILMFVNNEFPLPVNDEWKGQYFRDLAGEQKAQLWDYKVVVRFLRMTNDEEIRSLFTKLNTNNIALNDQELRNARYAGRFKQLSERLADNPFFQAIGLFTARDVRRMLDIEYVSELLLRQIAGISNKKDLLDTFYANFDDDFPGESAYEDEFNVCINLARSLITPDNQAFFRAKGTFYSLFGICLTFFRQTGQLHFKNAAGISEELTKFVTQSKDPYADENIVHQDVITYAEVSSRSTSDKSRRYERERILMGILAKAEGITAT